MTEAVAQRMVAHFRMFVQAGGANVEMKRERVDEIVAFLKADPSVKKAHVLQRIEFLRSRGYRRDEIEDALEAAGFVADYEAVLAADDIDAMSAAHGRTGGAAADDANGADANQGITGYISVANGYWRIGSQVFAYKGDMCYYPVPLLGFDMDRAEDVICVSHQLPSGEYGPKQYYPAGFKGVVPDEYPQHEAMRSGMTVIARDCDSDGKDRFREAVVLRVGPANEDGVFAVDLEWCHTSTRASNIDYREVRLLLHPRIVIQQLAEDARAEKSSRGSNDRLDSAGVFLVTAELTRAEQLRVVEKGGVLDEGPLLAHLKNFVHYPELDVFEQPRDLRTGANYVGQFGESPSENMPRTVPMLPESQATLSGIGFKFNLAALPRHPTSRKHYAHNPIADIALQCSRQQSMFVDPDFPPSEASLYGIGASPSADKVVWRRLSEIYYRPRLQAIGSRSSHVQVGSFAPKWFTELLCALQLTTEIEELVSPADDGWVYGAYALRFFVDGRWTYVVVDDFVPCDPATGNPIGVTSGSSSEILGAVVEKALAKLEGSYTALREARASFTLPRVWDDLTSNVTEIIDHEHLSSKTDVCGNLTDMVLEEYTSCFILARVAPISGIRYSGYGFEDGAFWYVDSAAEYVHPKTSTSTFTFHVVRRSGGPDVKKIDALQEQLLEVMDRNVVADLPDVQPCEVGYWLGSDDFFAVFDRSYCLRVINNFQKASYRGTFSGRPLAGGKMQGTQALLHNPQILLSVVQSTECIVELQLLDRRWMPETQRGASGTLQLQIIKGHAIGERPIDPTDTPNFVASSSLIDLGGDVEWANHPAVHIRMTLPGGNYVLCPTVGGPSTEGFVIKVFAVSAFYLKLLN